MRTSQFLLIILLAWQSTVVIADELPRGSQELIEKLEEFEREETAKLETLLAEKREAVGGDIGWLDRNEDDAKAREWMQPVVDKLGHAPIYLDGSAKKQRGRVAVGQWGTGRNIIGYLCRWKR